MALEIPPYSGWRPRSMRLGRASSDGQRSSKRSRLSKTRSDRFLYTSAHGYRLNPKRYAELSAIADKLNGRYVRPELSEPTHNAQV